MSYLAFIDLSDIFIRKVVGEGGEEAAMVLLVSPELGVCCVAKSFNGKK